MSNYARGARLEYKARDDLLARGYTVVRSAGSKGAVDLVATSVKHILLIQVKSPGGVTPDAIHKLRAVPVPCSGVQREIWEYHPPERRPTHLVCDQDLTLFDGGNLMKATLSQNTLALALKDVVRSAATRSTLPVLQNILIEAADNVYVHLSATNLEYGLRRSLLAMVQEAGAITVPAKTFSDMIATLDGEIELTILAGDKLRVKTTSGQSTFTGIPASDFPPFRPIATPLAAFSVDFKDFQRALGWTGFTAGTDEAREVLTGVCVTGNAETQTVTMASADGFRLGKATLPFKGSLDNPFKAILPAAALKTLAAMKAEGEMTVKIDDGRGVSFEGGGFWFWLLSITGAYPDIDQVIPKSSQVTATVVKADLLMAIKRANIIARTDGLLGKLEFQPANGKPACLVVCGSVTLTGSSETTLPISLDGNGLSVAFNTRFLADIVSACPGDEVVIGLNHASAPALIRPKAFEGEKPPLWVLMPMYLAKEAESAKAESVSAQG
jgi:DNA polymerase-3 subunit beta